ncbi:MAG: DUF2203 domain-containing protein [Candidatus Limnocylindria bacterium]
MTRIFDIDTATEALTEVAPLLANLADQRLELIRLRDRTLAAHQAAGVGPSEAAALDDDEARLLKLRMQGVIDQMAAAVARIDALGITLRDIERGLIDFPAEAGGRRVWLCWQLGEDAIRFWHELEAGFGARRPLIELL